MKINWMMVLAIIVSAVLFVFVNGNCYADENYPVAGTSVVVAEGTMGTEQPDMVKFGMNLGKDWKVRPTLAFPLIRIDLKSKDFSFELIPSGGYGVDWRDGILSLDAIAGFEFGKAEEPNEVLLGAILGVMKYTHIGFLWRMIEDRDGIPYLMLGTQLPNLTDGE